MRVYVIMENPDSSSNEFMVVHNADCKISEFLRAYINFEEDKLKQNPGIVRVFGAPLAYLGPQ